MSRVAYCTDMMSTGFMGAEHANIPVGGAVAVFAQGPVGLMATVGPGYWGRLWSLRWRWSRSAKKRKSSGPMSCWTSGTGSGQAILDLTGGQGGLVH